MEEIFVTEGFKKTQQLGKRFSKKLKGGDVVTLYGDLGSGKTTFAQGLAQGLGVKRRIISPTFVIVRSYKISIKHIYHIDLYRITNGRDIEGLGLSEIIENPQNIVVIEWPEKMGNLLPKNRWEIKFEYLDINKRRVAIKNIKSC